MNRYTTTFGLLFVCLVLLASDSSPKAFSQDAVATPISTGGITTASAGSPNNALDFDGTDDYVNAGTGIALANSSFTVAFWARRDTSGTDDFAIGHGAGGTNLGLHLGFLGSNNRFRCSFHANDLDTPEAYTDTAWHHWACTYNVSTNLRTIYRDGAQVAQDTSAADYQGVGELDIGRYLADFRSFDGSIDEVQIWNTVRTADQIRDTMYHELAGSESGLLAYYKLNESGSTSTAADSAGGDNNGILTNMTLPGVWRTSGAFGGPKNALDFDGVDDYVQVSGGLSLANASFTVEAWARRDTLGTFQMIISQGPASYSHGLHVGFRNTNVFMCGFYNNDLYTPAFIDTDWHHWACIYDVGTNLRTIYRDGVQVAQDTAWADYQGTGNFDIGRTAWSPNGGFYFDGQVDEVRIWNTARTAAEIRENMARALAGDETGLLGYWRMDYGLPGGNNTGLTTLYDITANHHDGTLNNLALTGSTSNWVASSAFNTWFGSLDTAWATPRNWSRNAAPATTDTVGIYGYLGGNNPTIGAAAQARDLVIGSSGALNMGGGNTLSIGSRFINYGAFTPNSFSVVFNGSGNEYLSLGVPTTFNNLVVNPGVTLIETESADNADLGGTLTNNGVIRKTQLIPAKGSYTFGLAGGPVNGAWVGLNVTRDSFTSIQVDRIDSNHPAASPEIQTGRYWRITPDGSGTADLTLPTAFAADLADGVCRYTGSDWDCARTSNTANSVTRNGVTTFSDWAVTNQTLGVFKTVTPETNVPYHSVVTYTLVLASGAASDTSAVLTDTLPAGVTFGHWVGAPPSGSVRNGDAITWTGTLAHTTAIMFTFTATHTGDYGDVIENTAHFSSTLGKGNDSAVFSVVCLNAVTVQNTNDSGPGSLRQAIADVCSNGPIDFANSLAGQTITLSSTLDLAKNLTIDGSRLAAPIQISGNNAVRVFRVTGSARVTLHTMRIVRGRDTTSNANCGGNSCGGGIKIEDGAVVTLTHSVVLSSTAGIGGGVVNGGTLTVLRSTLSGNSASSGGGIYNGGTLAVLHSTLSGNGDSGLDYGGGILNWSALTVTNSTLSGNSAKYGGGIINWGALTMTNSTLSGNNGGFDGGGIYNYGMLNYANTIIANSPAGGDCTLSGGGAIAANINNLVEDGSCNPALFGDPLLDVLADNGGDTLTHALLRGSPAIDAIPLVSCTLATDQRGVSRPQPAGGNCDIGAFESYGYMIFLPVVLRNP